jgi:D-glycero-D-manno-heptose 1,7-bisphosphate phosphatase
VTDRAVFLDRDGIVVEDAGFLREAVRVRLVAGAPQALAALAPSFRLVVVTNQTVVSRGLATEANVAALNVEIASELERAGGPRLDAFYVCPHHPAATVDRYRLECDCRKPRPGLLLRAADELYLDLERSFLVGDRPSDIAAGAAAGCRTVLVRTGAHTAPPIESPEPIDPALRADHECDTLAEAAAWILAA